MNCDSFDELFCNYFLCTYLRNLARDVFLGEKVGFLMGS